MMSPRDVHSINIGNLGGIVNGPPPLIPTELGQSVYQPSSNSSFVVPQPPLISNFVITQLSSNFVVPQPSLNFSVLVAQPSPNSNFVVPQPSPNSNLMASQQQRPCVDTPFWLVFIFGNVSRCNGYKGRISIGEDKKPLSPPDDIVLGHKEYIIYQKPKSGNLEQSEDKRNVNYHLWRTCIAPHFCNFDATQHITIPDSVTSDCSQSFNLEGIRCLCLTSHATQNFDYCCSNFTNHAYNHYVNCILTVLKPIWALLC